jgi:hypothetical protein
MFKILSYKQIICKIYIVKYIFYTMQRGHVGNSYVHNEQGEHPCLKLRFDIVVLPLLQLWLAWLKLNENGIHNIFLIYFESLFNAR